MRVCPVDAHLNVVHDVGHERRGPADFRLLAFAERRVLFDGLLEPLLKLKIKGFALRSRGRDIRSKDYLEAPIGRFQEPLLAALDERLGLLLRPAPRAPLWPYQDVDV
jgi:hypothetical protein